MNKIVNEFLLVGDKTMPEMHLKQLYLKWFYLQCCAIHKKQERIEKVYANWKYRFYLQKQT